MGLSVHPPSRREFLRSAAISVAGVALGRARLNGWQAGRPLKERFPDLSRHFIFEYYPWYGATPFKHWDQDGHVPPADLASNYVPLLGAYDSASTRVMEQHALWMKSAGAGAINVSWWGRDSDTDRLVPRLMDVMAAYDLRVTFHLEPYRNRRAAAYASDIEYLMRTYGDARKWDSFLLLRHEDGSVGPVFKSFRTILPAESTDCHGRTSAVADYTPDGEWREQTDRVRDTFAREFSGIRLLADSLDVARTKAAGFDGIAIYDNYVRPERWRSVAEDCTGRRLVFSFNVNPGFDGVVDLNPPDGGCYVPLPVEPGPRDYRWDGSDDRERAAEASKRRIADTFQATVSLQTDDRLFDRQCGFFLVYLNSFNEWHEGHQFEPMKNDSAIPEDQRPRRYHNGADGEYRLKTLTTLLATVE
jgi:Glycosyl hydrolase family 99